MSDVSENILIFKVAVRKLFHCLVYFLKHFLIFKKYINGYLHMPLLFKRLAWAFQLMASISWIVSFCIYNSYDHGDIWQLVAAMSWTISNLLAANEIFFSEDQNNLMLGGNEDGKNIKSP